VGREGCERRNLLSMEAGHTQEYYPHARSECRCHHVGCKGLFVEIPPLLNGLTSDAASNIGREFLVLVATIHNRTETYCGVLRTFGNRHKSRYLCNPTYA